MPEDFKDINAESQDSPEFQQTRVRLPKAPDVLGRIEERLGGNKMLVKCADGKNRNCRVPGRLRKFLWLRPGDIVTITPWELDKDKGDVVFKYKPNQASWINKQGYFDTEVAEF